MDRTLSIIIPTFNRKMALKKQLDFFYDEGVFNNNDIEFIVSDNASNDGTSELIENYIKYKNFDYNRNCENIGIIENFRKAIDKAKGKYVWLVGDDDKLHFGIVNKILDVISKYDVGHIFLNHSLMENGVIKKQKWITTLEKFYDSGFEMIDDIFKEANLGVLLFITANIHKRDIIMKANCHIDKLGERNNLATPLGYSLCDLKKSTYLISDVYIDDEVSGISWQDSKKMLYYRDLIAMWGIIAKTYDNPQILIKKCIRFMPRYSEFKYPLLVKSRKGKNNYALHLLFEYYPLKLLMDCLTFPFFLFYMFLSKKYKDII